MVVVISEGKELIQQHFTVQPELEQLLEERGKLEELKAVRDSDNLADFTWVRQDEPLGLGHAVLCAADAVGRSRVHVHAPGRPLARTGAGSPPAGRCVPGTPHPDPGADARVARADLTVRLRHGRGVARDGCTGSPRWSRNRARDEAASDLAIMGRYVLTPNIFDALR